MSDNITDEQIDEWMRTHAPNLKDDPIVRTTAKQILIGVTTSLQDGSSGQQIAWKQYEFERCCIEQLAIKYALTETSRGVAFNLLKTTKGYIEALQLAKAELNANQIHRFALGKGFTIYYQDVQASLTWYKLKYSALFKYMQGYLMVKENPFPEIELYEPKY